MPVSKPDAFPGCGDRPFHVPETYFVSARRSSRPSPRGSRRRSSAWVLLLGRRARLLADAGRLYHGRRIRGGEHAEPGPTRRSAAGGPVTTTSVPGVPARGGLLREELLRRLLGGPSTDEGTRQGNDMGTQAPLRVSTRPPTPSAKACRGVARALPGAPGARRATATTTEIWRCRAIRSLDRRRANQALDVTIQAQILEIVRELRSRLGMGIIWITHDLGLVGEIADRVMVMYAGYVVEQGPVAGDLRRSAAPRHPGAARHRAEGDRRPGAGRRDHRGSAAGSWPSRGPARSRRAARMSSTAAGSRTRRGCRSDRA